VELLGQANTFGLEHNLLVGTELGYNNVDQVVGQSPLAATSIYAPDSGIAPTTFAPNNNSTTNTDYRSYYIQDQIYLLKRQVSILAGARRDYFKQTAVNRRVNPPTSQILEGNFTDPRLGLAWIPSKELTVYGLFTSSHIQPTQANPNGEILKPNLGSIYELGIKGSFLNERLTATLAGYSLTQDHVSVTDPTRPGYQIDAGARKVEGVEIDGTFIISSQWTVLASAAYSDGEVTSDTTLIVGSPLPNSPTWQTSAWTRYDFKNGPLKRLSLGLGVIMADSFFVDNAGQISVSGFTRFDGLVRYRYKRVDVSLNLRNLLNKHYVQAAASAFDVKPGAPFSIQGSVRLKF
jgi:iron complex outermembrane receptor protein